MRIKLLMRWTVTWRAKVSRCIHSGEEGVLMSRAADLGGQFAGTHGGEDGDGCDGDERFQREHHILYTSWKAITRHHCNVQHQTERTEASEEPQLFYTVCHV